MRECYLTLCKYNFQQVVPVVQTEFADLLTLLEGQGMITVTSKSKRDNVKNRVVALSVCIDEIEKAIETSPLLMNVMRDGVKALSKVCK